MKKIISLVVLTVFCLSLAAVGVFAAEEPEVRPEPSLHWRADTTGKYRTNDNVTSIVCVQATEGTSARVLLFEKSVVNGKPVWTKTLECDGVIGKEGLGKTKEGDNKTPVGDFGIVEAFGIKENPGTELPYVDVTEDTYCCGDEVAYNQIIDIKDYPHDCSEGEHMIEYTPEYNYGFFLDYNKEGTMGLGSAIFFHCKGANTYTGGCIAVDEECMVQILKAVNEHSRVIIDYAPSSSY